jgi:alpha-beta hydrolase superfamily lysophospholipase
LVHGLGEHSGRYDHVGRFLADRGHDVASFDNRGFGRSGGRRGHIDRFHQFLDDVEERLDERRALGVPVVLLGHSLGGLICGDYLVSDRPQPDLAILSAPALDAITARWRRVAAPIMGRIAPRLFFPNEIDPAALTRDGEIQQAYADDPLRVGGVTARMGHELLVAMERVTANAARVRVPTYVLHGDDDAVVPLAASEPLAAVEGVTRRVWNGFRHESFNEPEWEQVLAEVDQWLGDQLPGAAEGEAADA